MVLVVMQLCALVVCVEQMNWIVVAHLSAVPLVALVEVVLDW